MDYAKCINSIQALAKKQGISMKFLCDQLGKRRSFLSEVRLGKDRIHDNEIEVIASILNTTPAYLRGETDDPTAPSEPEVRTVPDWVAEIKKDPRKEGIMQRMAEMSAEELLKLEKILDMILEEK